VALLFASSAWCGFLHVLTTSAELVALIAGLQELSELLAGAWMLLLLLLLLPWRSFSVKLVLLAARLLPLLQALDADMLSNVKVSSG